MRSCDAYLQDFRHDISYLEGDLHGQGDRLMVMLYVANQTCHNPLWFPSSHHQVEIKTLVLFWTQTYRIQVSQPINQTICNDDILLHYIKTSLKNTFTEFYIVACDTPILPVEGSTSILWMLSILSHWKKTQVLLWFHIWYQQEI